MTMPREFGLAFFLQLLRIFPMDFVSNSFPHYPENPQSREISKFLKSTRDAAVSAQSIF
jgi:hypothetical protein